MKKLIGYVWRLTLSLLLAISWLSLETTPALAVHRMRVRVTITEVNNLLQGCFDIVPWGCSRPDYFAVVTLISRNERRELDTRADFVQDRDNITPNWVLDFGLVETEGLAIELRIFDFDGGLAGTFNQGNQQADVQPGPGMTFTMPVTPGIRGFDTTANGNAEVDTRVRGTIEATVEPIRLTGMSVNPIFFDPRLGETIRVTGLVSEPVSVQDISLTMSVSGPGGVFTTSMFTLGADNQHFEFIWDGWINGVIALPGAYTITINGQTVAPDVWWIPPPAPVIVAVINRPETDLVFLDFDPVDNWYPGLGPLQVRYSTGSDASVTGRIFEGDHCTGALRRTFVPMSLTSGVSTLGWDGKDETGIYVLPGDYSVEVTADFRIGNPIQFCRPFSVITSPPLELAVEHAPIVPMVNNTMVFRASALTATHAGRLTGRIEVWIADQNAVSARTAPISPVRICQRSAVCEVNLANLTQRTGRIAYRAVAYDIDGERIETPWRIVDVVDESVVGSNNAIAVGVASQSFSLIRPETTLDIVFRPGSNYELWQVNGGRREFLDDVAAGIREFWGIGRLHRPSTLLANQTQLSFWIMLNNVRVNPLNPDLSGSPCIFPIDRSLPWFADVAAIVHRVDCRDWASPFYHVYSARAPEISWHELHHAAFGLSDEYCCDGGYWQLPEHPNLFFWPGDCNLDLNAPPGGCRPVRPAGNILPGQQTRWWRIDLDPDAMIDNSFQQSAEVRRSNWVFDQCRLGRC